jgi:hypothetical protein
MRLILENIYLVKCLTNLGYSAFSKDFLFQKVSEFIKKKLNDANSMNPDQKTILENKLSRIIQDLGLDYQAYMEHHNRIIRIPISNNNTVMTPFAGGFVISQQGTTQPPFMQTTKIIPMPAKPKETNIFQICENHPNPQLCICAAYPLSQVCKKDYCLNHPNYYECNPNFCNNISSDEDACRCKLNPKDLRCQCMLNPLQKECFCLRSPNSALCHPEFCNNIDNSNEIFCLCRNNPRAPECLPNYCSENKYDERCTCLLNPNGNQCTCKFDPSKCQRNSSRCAKDDIYCQCRDHPNYTQCVCLAYPLAKICKGDYCVNNSLAYECGPKKNCKANTIHPSCSCRKYFDGKCFCDLDPKFCTQNQSLTNEAPTPLIAKPIPFQTPAISSQQFQSQLVNQMPAVTPTQTQFISPQQNVVNHNNNLLQPVQTINNNLIPTNQQNVVNHNNNLSQPVQTINNNLIPSGQQILPIQNNLSPEITQINNNLPITNVNQINQPVGMPNNAVSNSNANIPLTGMSANNKPVAFSTPQVNQPNQSNNSNLNTNFQQALNDQEQSSIDQQSQCKLKNEHELNQNSILQIANPPLNNNAPNLVQMTGPIITQI